MTDGRKLEFLKGTAAEHCQFHRERVMFCLKGGQVEIAGSGNPDSHIEWFEKEGWVQEGNAERFLEENARGFYLPDANELYCYKGIGWFFDDMLMTELLDKMAGLKDALCFNEDTKVYLGPKDRFIGEREYKNHFMGTVRELVGKSNAVEV